MKDQAKKLVGRFFPRGLNPTQDFWEWERAKQHALICVEEKIMTIDEITTFISVETTKGTIVDDYLDKQREELEQLKQEIEKL